jgi:hypothetical protein
MSAIPTTDRVAAPTEPGSVTPGDRGSFAAVFAPRVLEVQALSGPVASGESVLSIRLAKYQRSEARFEPVTLSVTMRQGRILKIDPPVVSERELQQVLKRHFRDRFDRTDGPARAGSGDVPGPLVSALLRGLEGELAGPRLDVRRTGLHRRLEDRGIAQRKQQAADGWGHQLVVLGRYHRRRGDFLGGALGVGEEAGFGFATGLRVKGLTGDLNEEALGYDHVDGARMFAVADAHHGARSGEIVIAKLLELFRLGFGEGARVSSREALPFLVNAVYRAHETVSRDIRVDRSRCSLVTALVCGDRAHWASVSDALLFRCDAGRIVRVNRDLGFEAHGKKSSVWLGDPGLTRRHIDSGSEDLGGKLLFMASDGVLAHPRFRLRTMLASLEGARDLSHETHALAAEYAADGQDCAAYAALRSSRPEAGLGAER